MIDVDFSAYSIFRGVPLEKLDMLTGCVKSKTNTANKGDDVLGLIEASKCCALILQGSVELTLNDGRTIIVERDSLIGKGCFEKDGISVVIKAAALEKCELFGIGFDSAMIPCWFSCFFHAVFIDNVKTIILDQNKKFGI